MMGNIVSELSIVRSLYLVSVFWKVLGQKQGKLLCVKDQDGLSRNADASQLMDDKRPNGEKEMYFMSGAYKTRFFLFTLLHLGHRSTLMDGSFAQRS